MYSNLAVINQDFTMDQVITCFSGDRLGFYLEFFDGLELCHVFPELISHCSLQSAGVAEGSQQLQLSLNSQAGRSPRLPTDEGRRPT